MKTNVASRLSVRVKFKSFEQIELCIIDSSTGEIQLEEIPVNLGKAFPEQAKPTVVDTSHDGEDKKESSESTESDDGNNNIITNKVGKGGKSSNDTNGDEDGGTQRE